MTKSQDYPMSYNVIVKKFGGSIQKTPADFDKIVQNILSDREKHKQIIVISATYLKTDKLYQEIDSLNTGASEKLKSLVLATGEQESLGKIGIALEKHGVLTEYMFGVDIPLYTEKSFSNSDIKAIARERIYKKLDTYDVILVAGFQGFNLEQQKITTLGRGGSDLTASALSATLNCPCFFFKIPH